jgi:hypothetical protein
MSKRNVKSYSKFTYEDLKLLGLRTIVKDLFEGKSLPAIAPSEWLRETLEGGAEFSLETEKARSEFIIAPILRELYKNNKNVFSIYSGFNFTVDAKKGLQGFCDFLLAKPPRNLVPDSPIIAVVEAKLNDVLTAAVPQCVAEMYATRLWNEKYENEQQDIYGIITTGNLWLILRLQQGMTIEIDTKQYTVLQLDLLLGVLQHIVNQFKTN